MPLPTQATLIYSATLTNPMLGLATLQDKLNGVILYTSATTDPVLNGLYDCTVASDTPGSSGSTATRTIVLNLGSRFFQQFPTESAWIGCFPNLYTSTLAQEAQTPVVATTPTFT